MIKLAILASGNGSNAEEIIKYFKNDTQVEVSLILSNKPSAFVLERAKNNGIPSHVFNVTDLKEGKVLEILHEVKIDFIVLAGFLLLIPKNLVEAFPNRIINIHPALLPKYGGKGMYGDKVHEAVKESGDNQSGITIHFVNDKYDEGQIIYQSECPVTAKDTPLTIANKVHQLEYAHYPRVIAEVIKK